MELRPWETIPDSREILHENAWFSLYREKFMLPSGKEGTYHVVQGEPSAMIIPQLPNGKFRLVKQYRYLTRSESIEFPCGNARHGAYVDAIEDAALRELAEEAHLEGDLRMIGKFSPWNGVSTEVCFVFFAKECREKTATADETEEFVFLDLAEDEIDKAIAKGDIVDGMSLAAWMLYKSTYANL